LIAAYGAGDGGGRLLFRGHHLSLTESTGEHWICIRTIRWGKFTFPIQSWRK
jgi:hypothetical protein